MRGMKDMAALQRAIDEILSMSMEVNTLEEAREILIRSGVMDEKDYSIKPAYRDILVKIEDNDETDK